MALVDRQREFCGHLVAGFPRLNLRGWSLRGAAAVTGNGTQENLVKPVTTGPLDHGSDGILQWRLDRLTDLKTWAAIYFPGGSEAWATIEAQAAFTLYETARDYKALDAELRAGTKSLETLTANFCWVFERPSKAHAALDKRIQYARDTYAVMTSMEPKGKTTAGAAAGAAGASGIGAVLLYLQQGPGVGVLIALGVAILLGAAYVVASRKRPAAKDESKGPSLIDQGETLLGEFVRAQDELAAAQARVDELRAAMLAHIKECQEAIGA